MRTFKVTQLLTLLSLLIFSCTTLAYSADEWVSKSAVERQQLRQSMTYSEILNIWNSLSLDQKLAMNETNAALSAIQAGQDKPAPYGSPYSVNQWLIKSPAERASLRASMSTNQIMSLWEALSLSQKNAMTVINKSYANLQNAGADLCAGYSDVQRIEMIVDDTRYETRSHFPFLEKTVIAAKFTVPLSFQTGYRFVEASVAEYDGPPTFRQSTISTQACDFRSTDITGANGPLATGYGTTSSASVAVAANENGPKLLPGQTYYYNVRHYSPDIGVTCNTGTSCNAALVIMGRR